MSEQQKVFDGMLEALRSAEVALNSCYQVADYPANGKSDQDDALREVRFAIEKATRFTDNQLPDDQTISPQPVQPK